MPDAHTIAWVEAGRRYVRVRRRYWICFVSMFGVFALLVPPMIAFGTEWRPDVRDAIVQLVGIIFTGFWLGAAIAWVQLLRFRCPVCGNRFITAGFVTWPGDRCRHCGIDLRAASMHID